jgi:hypothetical protein
LVFTEFQTDDRKHKCKCSLTPLLDIEGAFCINDRLSLHGKSYRVLGIAGPLRFRRLTAGSAIEDGTYNLVDVRRTDRGPSVFNWP